jgi:hypothetical protein
LSEEPRGLGCVAFAHLRDARIARRRLDLKNLGEMPEIGDV